jgi:predicted CopG family antitoxin
MSTIWVKEDVKEELLRYASELQLKLGHRVDFNEAIRRLLHSRRRNRELLERACEPLPGFEEAYKELREERRRDEERSERIIRD